MSVTVLGDASLVGGDVPDGDLVVVVGDVPAPEGAHVRLAAVGSGRLVAPVGTGLWRRAPWPAADDLLAAPSAPPAAPALVVGAGGERLAGRLRESGLPVESVDRLDRDCLLASSAVLFAGAPGEPLPATAPAVLAAGRVLILPRAEPAFGLLPGVDHLAYEDEDEAVQFTDMALTHPDALDLIRAMGRVAVRAHLASAVLARWAVDVELETGGA